MLWKERFHKTVPAAVTLTAVKSLTAADRDSGRASATTVRKAASAALLLRLATDTVRSDRKSSREFRHEMYSNGIRW